MKKIIIGIIVAIILVVGIAIPVGVSRADVDNDVRCSEESITNKTTTKKNTIDDTTVDLETTETTIETTIVEETTVAVVETTKANPKPVETTAKETTYVETTTEDNSNCQVSHNWPDNAQEANPSSEGCVITYHCLNDWSHTYNKVISHQWKKTSTNDDGTINYTCSMCGGTYTAEPPAETTSASSNGKYIGNFKITGFYAGEGQTVSASGMKLIPWATCAMNNSRRKELGLNYGDYVYVEGIGNLKIVDCGCSYGTLDVYVNNKSEAYALTSYRNVYRG